MQLFAEGWAYLMANPMSFVYMTGGILMGIIFGCIPGLTAVLGVTLMIPFTYAMSAAEGLSTLIGIYVGGISGGPISARLLKMVDVLGQKLASFSTTAATVSTLVGKFDDLYLGFEFTKQ